MGAPELQDHAGGELGRARSAVTHGRRSGIGPDDGANVIMGRATRARLRAASNWTKDNGTHSKACEVESAFRGSSRRAVEAAVNPYT